MMEMVKELSIIRGKMKTYNFMLGQITHFKLLNPSNAIRKRKHHNTIYYFFECEVISKDDKLIPIGKHTIQLPSKRVVYPMIIQIKELKRLNESVNVTIEKKSSQRFDITIHKN